jgi:hypothetical protein
MKIKPRLSFWQLWNMSFGYVGIQFGFALQNANMSRIFETLGARVGRKYSDSMDRSTGVGPADSAHHWSPE